MRLSSTFEKIARQFEIEFAELAREIDHNLSAGEARERTLATLLRKYLPQRAGVDRGFVIDAVGGQSQQIDLIIFDKSAGAVFEAAGVKYFPCETVLAVGEVKSDIVSTATFRDALSRIQSVKVLDRSNRGTNKPITGPGVSTEQIVRFDPATNHRDQIFSFVFTHISLRSPTLVSEFQDYLATHPRTLWPNLFCSFGDVILTYETDDGRVYPSAMEAKMIAITADTERKNLLLLFFCILASFVNEAHIARPEYFDYAYIKSTQIVSHPLFKEV